MKFSVLISVYKNDCPDYFRIALESISTAQTLKPSQVVIVLDGPVPEEIIKIIDEVKIREADIEFTVLAKEVNQGLAAALNTGIDYCKYQWIARMDADDISLPDRFSRQAAYIGINPEVEVLGGAISEFSEIPGDLCSERHVGLSQEDIMRMAKRRTPMNHVSVMYRKEAVIRAGKYSEDFGKLEDYKLWVDLISVKACMRNIDDVLVYVRTGNGFVSRRSNRREIKDWDMLQCYLLKNRMVTPITAFINKLYIRCFIYMPGWMKKMAYRFFLRK